MKIHLDFNDDQWYEFAKNIPDEGYVIIEEFWEDDCEWAHIEILDDKWKTWVALKHPDWIIDAPE
jgi:hypothetical protein